MDGPVPECESCIRVSRSITSRERDSEAIFLIYAPLLNDTFSSFIQAFVALGIISVNWAIFFRLLYSGFFEVLTKAYLEQMVAKPKSTVENAKGATS